MTTFAYVTSILTKVWALITAVFMAVTGIIQGTPAQSEKLNLENEYQLVLEDALGSGQGLAYDDGYLYTSGAVSSIYFGGLGKIDPATMDFTVQKFDAIPYEFKKAGYDHIGGIGVCNGKIYAAVEDKAEEIPLVLIYDAETLEYTGVYTDMSNEVLNDGIPWCTVDTDNGYLYCSAFHNAEVILAYNLDDLSFSHYITLSETCDRVQAGAYYDGKLYLNLDPSTKDNSKEIAVVDVKTGCVENRYNRGTGGIKTETEGIAVYEKDGKTVITVTDYDKTVALFIREYTVR